jgi:microcystin-dependent protein
MKLTSRFKFKLLEEDGSDHPTAYREAINALGNALDSLLYEPGDLRFTHRTILTTGWLKAEGQQVLLATYKALYEGLGGAGNPALTTGAESGKFFLPDYRERVPIGAGATLKTLGAKVGEATHVLSTGEMPAHGHGVNDPTHTHTIGALIPHFNTEFGENYWAGGNGNNGGFTNRASNASATGISIQSTGGGGAHNNMQPSTVCNIWIKT